jgi:hypothetical protein
MHRLFFQACGTPSSFAGALYGYNVPHRQQGVVIVKKIFTAMAQGDDE